VCANEREREIGVNGEERRGVVENLRREIQ